MKKTFLCLLVVLRSAGLQAQTLPDIQQREPFSIGEKLALHSGVLDENRTLNIYLPYGYHPDSARQYPVIYLLDGSADEDFIHIAGLVQFGSFSWINMVPECIVVGVANVDRKRDFTWPTRNTEDKKAFPTTGGSERFIRFLQQEVQPLVDKTYRTSGSNILIGQSLGGLLATEILFTSPGLFDHYIIVSPSLWWDDESLLQRQPAPLTKPTSVYIAVGKEGAIMERVARALYDKLEQSKNAQTRLFFKFLEAQDHGDALHLAVYDALEKLFKKETAK